MAVTYDDGLQPARHDYPELADPSHCAPEYVPRQAYTSDSVKPNGNYSTVAPYELSSSSTFGVQQTAAAPPYNVHDQPTPASQPAPDLSPGESSEKPLPRRGKTILGCTTVVFVLSCIIAVLSMAVIGLAAATGIESHRANTNANKMMEWNAQMNTTSQASTGEGPPPAAVSSGSSSEPTSDSGSDSEPGTGSGSDSNSGPPPPPAGTGTGTKTITVSAAKTTETITVTPASAISAIDDGCSEEPEKAHGSTYTAYKRFNSLKFTRYCQRDPDGTILMVIFTSTFQQCMDACASYTTYLPASFPSGGDKTKCDGLSFIPEWADKSAASKENSRGNCYLKNGVKGEGAENKKKVGVHAAIVTK
ncbi:hypothetical protein QBC40DRAFT_303841 [Triangularia verruculosa]|uniref:Uncharacterized protein n=1 Tax=Triangularia verruculosa TaxID=2587418 RepID=A0AAN7B0Q5_9PEZI|nr:hypothetical protein QBC40DRAFT_303841 [Triangularia verruculosa]